MYIIYTSVLYIFTKSVVAMLLNKIVYILIAVFSEETSI
jgi:hypothetical protein